MKHKLIIALFLFLSVLTATENNFFPLPTSQDHQIAFEEFRRGVQSYYKASYNEAILLFEKALSILPDEPIILEWLGKAYYSSGLEDACLQQWDVAIKANHGGILLKNKAEVVRERRSFSFDLMDGLKFSESTSYASTFQDKRLFRQPLSAIAMEDGSFWATAYGTNEVLHFDVNGKIVDRTKGPIEGFDRPFDIIRTKNNHILVSEFASDRVSVLTKEGKFVRYFGKSGVKEGELLGPQFLATDSYDNIYVSDFGNARVSVFSFEGKPLFHFGEKNAQFSGFVAPSGVCVIDDCATPDANGNILISDFKNETVEVTSRISELAGGFFVTIKRVFSNNFPKVEMELLVENRNRQQIVGLESLNFTVTENHNPVLDYSLDGAGFFREGCDVSILLERSPRMEKEKEIVDKAIKEIALAMRGKGKISIFSAGRQPNKEGDYFPEDIIDYIPRFKGEVADNWKFDLALRLASSNLLNAQARRAVIFLSFNDLKEENFGTYGLDELSSYMANNNIRFYSISLKEGSSCDELAYLIKKTGGEATYMYVNEGLSPLISRISKMQTGLYKLSYTSSMDSDFGRRFLPVEVEVRLLNRSGRDETSYYPPAE